MKLATVLFTILFGLALVYGFFVPDAKGFNQPGMARIVFYHVPSAFISSYFIGLSAFFGWKYLKTKKKDVAVRLHSAVDLGTIFALSTMLTGIIFSRVQWNAWWSNDPRQVSFLIVLLIYLALLGLRSSMTDFSQKAKVCSGYAVVALLPAIFLTFVFPRLPQVKQWSFHPSDTIPKNELDSWYSLGLYGHLAVIAFGAWIVYQLSVKTGLIELKKEEAYDELDTHSAPDHRSRRVVRVHHDAEQQD